ncbi:MAG TPA: hypothetical protein EYN38_01085 [Flavobacteriales bacterium]|nr:hypothetical protein [Flavobacteriales bacterium]HIB00389.1 hypothetical protein [Phycisphaerales bacterium]HIO71680.1 hypothetical protein [Flavobacteriales bacterium]
MLDYLKLFRFPNLIIIALILYLMRYLVIEQLLVTNGLVLQMSAFDFSLLVLATLMITAAGYAINDYFDTKVDLKNRPDKIVVGRTIKRRVAMVLHVVMSAIGILIGIFIALKNHLYELALINFFTVVLLWFYSTRFKHQLIIGNLIISMLAALVALIVGLYELPLLRKLSPEIVNTPEYKLIWFWIIGYSIFAFVATLAREIIKDSEDVEGDKQYGSVTVAVRYGLEKTKYVVICIVAIMVLSIAYLQFLFFSDWQAVVYISILIHIPLFFLIWTIIKAADPKDYHRASWIMKFVMVAGIVFSAVVEPRLAIFGL